MSPENAQERKNEPRLQGFLPAKHQATVDVFNAPAHKNNMLKRPHSILRISSKDISPKKSTI